MSHVIDCVVDTTPMAHSINSVSGHINATTTAVVGMKAAVVAAEKEGADHVCANVNRGFYTLIRSQISQKMAALRSQVDSHLMSLNQQRKQLIGIRNRMERDYHMLSARYLKLFNSINRNLEQRVMELDRPVMNFAKRDMEQVSNRTTMLTATVPVSQEESVSHSQRMLASNLKYRGLKALESMQRFLDGSQQLQSITGRILLPMRIDTDKRRVAFPVVVCESRMDAADNRSTQVYVNSSALAPSAQNVVRSVVGQQAPDMDWSGRLAPNSAVNNEFARLVNRSDMSERAKQMAMALMNKSSISTL